jgi:hypothetical protein
LLVEGVSHFVYFTLRARANRQVSALELELQAEVDKFACCVLLSANRAEGDPARGRAGAAGWARGLFEDVRFADDLDPEEHDRYRTANREARRYAAALSRRFIDSDRLGDMLPELRHFYRMPLAEKRAHIARADG